MQRFCYPNQRKQAGIAPTAFDAANVRKIKLSIESELFLGHLSRLAEAADIGSNNIFPVHHGGAWASRRIKVLGTIVPVMLAHCMDGDHNTGSMTSAGDDASKPTVPDIVPAVGIPDLLAVAPSETTGREKQTAKRAVQILVAAGIGFQEPTKTERRALAVAFAMDGKIVYGAAFDVLRVSSPIDLSNPPEIHRRLSDITLFEIKSTNRPTIKDDFGGYFFDLTTAELLVAQSLGAQYRFAFVNTITGTHIELSLNQLFAKARKIYPKWAVTF